LSTRKRFIADLLFGSQLVLGVFFAGSRIVRMSQTLQGILLSEFILIGSFCALNLGLAITANRVQSTRISKQTVVIYTFWSVALVGCVGMVLTRGTYQWSRLDTITLAVAALAGSAVVVFGRVRYGLPVRDPIVRGYLAAVFKGWPQLTLAFNIAQKGGTGLPLLAVILGHATILIRIGQLVFALREAGWDRNRRGSMISEAWNEGTWLITTAVWIIY
jgi:hypothetical protein